MEDQQDFNPPNDLGKLIAREVLSLHAMYPLVPAAELFELVMKDRRGTEVEFGSLADPFAHAEGSPLANLLVDAFYPRTSQEQAILDHGTEGEQSSLLEFEESRPGYAERVFFVKYQLNGYPSA